MADNPLTWSRRYATYALQERLAVGNPKNDMLRTRIAAIRAGNGDNFPEVRSVFLCLTENAIAMEARSGETACGLDPKDDSAGRKASPTRPHHPPEGE